MTHEYEGHYRTKHESDAEPDPTLAKLIREKAKDDRLPCASAFTVAEMAGASPREVGRVADLLEMKITECLTEMIFREADALDLGYACVCHADFGLPEGLDINIKLIRDKTLMQGHNCCNHRYVLGG